MIHLKWFTDHYKNNLQKLHVETILLFDIVANSFRDVFIFQVFVSPGKLLVLFFFLKFSLMLIAAQIKLFNWKNTDPKLKAALL